MSSEKKTNDATYGEDRAKHRAAIKERIIGAVNKSGLTPYALYQRINDENASTYTDEERYNYGISYPTFLQTCNPDHPNICNLDTCLAIARYLKLPLDSLFAPPGEDTHTSESRIVTYPNAPYEILADSRYFGTFHGYMYSLNTNNKNAIEHFVLTINEHGASMRIYYYTKNPDGQTERSFLDLAGTPIQIKDENVYMVLTNADGNLVILAFAYQEYTKKDLYYRNGAILASGRGTDRHPYVESFVLFDKQLHTSSYTYLPGMLLLSDRDFHVPAESATHLAQKEDDVETLFKELSSHIRKEEYYVIREETLLSCDRPDLPKSTILSALLKLKAEATDAVQSYFPHITPYTRLSLSMNKIDSEE